MNMAQKPKIAIMDLIRHILAHNMHTGKETTIEHQKKLSHGSHLYGMLKNGRFEVVLPMNMAKKRKMVIKLTNLDRLFT